MKEIQGWIRKTFEPLVKDIVECKSKEDSEKIWNKAGFSFKDKCDCELRDRIWHPNKDTCENCRKIK